MLKKSIAVLCVVLSALITAIGVSAENLKIGSEGTEVVRLQMNLNGLGYAKLTADGIYGSATESAVRVFQTSNGLTADGIAGDKTQASIKSIVQNLQTKLKALGYNPGTADGIYGDLTAAAVKKFQAANGLTADGLAGYRTLNKLASVSGGSTGNARYASTSSNVRTYSLAADGSKTLYGFKISEFACKDGSDKILIDDKLAALLQDISNHFGKAVNITSAYRTSSYNARVGGSANSLHVQGKAADISISGVSPREIARYAESLGVKGIGLYSNFVHVDTPVSYTHL